MYHLEQRRTVSGRCDKLSLLFSLDFCTFSRSRLRHSCSLWRWCISLTFCIKVLSYLIRKEEGESYSCDRVCNPTAPPLQFPRAAPQPPSQPPELSACQAHQVLPLDHLGHDFLNLLVLSKKHPGTNAPYKSLCLVPEHTEPLSYPSTPLHLFLASFTQSLRLPSSLLISQLDKFGLGIRGEKASLVERALRSVITPC